MRTILIGAAALLGLAAGDLAQMPNAPLVASALLAILAAVLTRQHTTWCTLALVACAASLGCLRASTGPFAVPLAAPMAAFDGLRQASDASIHAYLPEPQASLASGVLLGGSGHLDAPFRADLRRSGLAHLVAIDGFKQVVVAAAVGSWAVWALGARVGALTGLMAIGAYTLLSGAHPSAVRAALMAGLATLAALGGRVADPLTSVLLATLIMTMVQPRVLLDVGFQMSLSATLGIVLFWPRLRRRLRRWPPALAEPVGLTLAATTSSLPVALSTFDQVSLVSPLAHVLAVPLVPAVMIGAALLAASASLPPLAGIVSWLVWVPTSVLAWVVHAFGELPAAAVSTGRLPSSTSLWLAAVLLAGGLLELPELRDLRHALRRLAPLAASSASLAALAFISVVRPDGRLHVDPLRVGTGQAIFIRGPTGRTILVVSGRIDRLALASAVADHLAPWEHRLNVAVSLDSRAEGALKTTLARYPADDRVHTPTRVDAGGGVSLDVTMQNGQVAVRSAPTTFAARPGSAD